ncbi:MAG TPA: IS110 family transposase [Methylomirabilota bacterium]|jgi:transposase|nr:IS110 family transposase [Methylomirabilota bacterium]
MEQDTIYVGLDDSKRVIVAGILRPGQHEPEGRRIPNEPHAIGQLVKRLQREGTVHAAYEAGPAGYALYRRLTALGVTCTVAAPALTPRKPGDRIKTDKRDALKLARLLRAGELTAIHVPDEAQEAVRDLVRCREDIHEDVRRWQHRLVRFLDRHDRVYCPGRHWTARHWAWLRAQQFDDPALQHTLAAHLHAVEHALARRADLERELQALAQRAPYAEPVGWLRCFRGIDTLSAMVLLTELHDFQRFHTPRELMAFLGLVPSELTTADRHRRFGITKAGNTHARRILVEAAWHYRHRPRCSARLAARSAGQPSALQALAWKAQTRLHRRYCHLVGRGKRSPVAIVAVARELVGFLWAAMRQVQPAS